MKKILLLITLALFIVPFTACNGFTYDGCLTVGSFEINNSNEISLSYQKFNGAKDYTMYLSDGEVLKVEITSESGKLDALVYMDGDEAIYEGHDLGSTSFTLNINKTGQYIIKMTANNHKGSYKFTKN